MITIIPAIDIIDGQCVRLSQGAFDTKKVYNENPLEVAKQFEEAGIRRLHMVDLDGARQKKIINWPVLKKVASGTNLEIDFGGGLQSEKDIQLAFECGAKQITAGSIAVKNRSKVLDWIDRFGADRIILGADFKDGKIAISGWQEGSSEEIFPFLQDYFGGGIRTVISTDVSRDGMLTGPATQLYRDIKSRFPEMNVIASGGISDINDVKKLNDYNIDGVIIGKAIYEGRIKLKELEPFLC